MAEVTSGKLLINHYNPSVGSSQSALEWWFNDSDQNINDNTTLIHWRTYIVKNSSIYSRLGYRQNWVTIDDRVGTISNITGNTGQVVVGSGSGAPANTTIAEGTFLVTHANDGKASFYIEAGIACYVYSDTMVEGLLFEIKSIPRKATISSVTMTNDESNYIIKIDSKAGPAITSISYALDFNEADTGTPFKDYRSFTPGSYYYSLESPFSYPEQIAIWNQITSGHGPIDVWVKVKSVLNGVTYIDKKRTSVELINYKPSVGVTIQDINPDTAALTSGLSTSDVLIKGHNTVQVLMQGGGSKGPLSVVTAYLTKNGTAEVGDQLGTIYNTKIPTFYTYVEDLRGNKPDAYPLITTVEMVDYIEPTSVMDRSWPSVLGVMNVKCHGDCFKGDFGQTENELTAYYRYKESSDEQYSDWYEMDVEISETTNTYEATSELSGLDYHKVYTFQTCVCDKIYTTKTILSNPMNVQGRPVYDWGESDFSMNVPMTVDGDVDITGQFKINGTPIGGGGGSGEFTPIGTISGWSTDTAPDGWLICDGSAVSRTAYDKLFAVIGTTWGAGDGTTTFNLPNFKGKTLIGQDLLDNDFKFVGSYFGEKEHNLTVNELPSHYHKITVAGGQHQYNNSSSDASDPTSLWNDTDNVKGSEGNAVRLFWCQNGNRREGRTSSILNSNSGNQSHNNMQPSGVGNYIIKYAQVSTEALPKEAGIPVGSILEFNGTEDQIPVGYAKYEDNYEKSSIFLGLGSESRGWSGTGWSILTLPQIIEQKNNKITISNDGGAIIGEGITRIRVVCNLAVQSLSSSNWLMTDITRTRSSSNTQIVKNIIAGGSWASTHIEATFDVQNGDKIYFRINKDAGGTITFHNLWSGSFGSGHSCYMYIEEV